MLIVTHDNTKVVEVLRESKNISFETKNTIAETICSIAKSFPNQNLVWCFYKNYDNLNIKYLESLTIHKNHIRSFASKNYLKDAIGYIEFSPFIKINKNVVFPTWQMSGCVGVINTSVLNQVSDKIKFDKDFSYFLNSLAKRMMPQGLFCYSDCNLLLDNSKIEGETQLKNTFVFVKQHYKVVWLFLLFLNKIIYEKSFPIVSFIKAFFHKRRKPISFDSIEEESRTILHKTIDVLIPTIGRKEHLLNFLDCLKKQTLLPKRVIIIEQNPDDNSVSDFDFKASDFPFEIVHFFTHKTGACNARNIGLDNIISEYTFFADDDILIENDFIELAFQEMSKYPCNAFIFSCLNVGQAKQYNKVSQTTIFGSGCSIVQSEVVKNIRFDTQFEFGFGEDSDFGMQIRNKGEDVLYLPSPEIIHLKAPIGGFRTVTKKATTRKNKPSETVILFKKKHDTTEQINGFYTLYNVNKIIRKLKFKF